MQQLTDFTINLFLNRKHLRSYSFYVYDILCYLQVQILNFLINVQSKTRSTFFAGPKEMGKLEKTFHYKMLLYNESLIIIIL